MPKSWGAETPGERRSRIARQRRRQASHDKHEAARRSRKAAGGGCLIILLIAAAMGIVLAMLPALVNGGVL
jgi:hypothetical protein